MPADPWLFQEPQLTTAQHGISMLVLAAPTKQLTRDLATRGSKYHRIPGKVATPHTLYPGTRPNPISIPAGVCDNGDSALPASYNLGAMDMPAPGSMRRVDMLSLT